MATEPTYYSDEHGIRITPTRAIFGKKTFAMANITSITTKKKYQFWMLLIIFLFAILGFSVYLLLGLFIILLGIICLIAFPKHSLIITSTAGETSALSSFDKQRVNSVAMAFNEALIKRG
jgi:hypothetical protein